MIQPVSTAHRDGGLKVHIPWKTVTAVVVAIVGATSAIMVAVIEGIS